MEQDQYTGKSGATPPRPAGPPLSGIGSPAPGVQHSGLSRASVWAVVAAVLGAGVFLYFRYERGIVALFDRSH